MQAGSLTATDLACRRGDRVLFAGLSLRLAPGEALHVTGPNGIGKSSLLRILGGLLPPYTGVVAHSGGVGLLDERAALDPQVTLGRALAFWQRIDGLDPHGETGHDDLLDLLGLADLLDVPVRYLSTGQTKRAGIARLIGQRAPIWLLDEPLNGLDTAAARLVEVLIAAHYEDGGLCVIASHQPLGMTALERLDLQQYVQATQPA